MPDVELASVTGVDILATGEWPLSSGPATFTEQDLADAIDAATCPSVGQPKLKLGHIDPRFDGQPAVGYVANLHTTAGGNKLTGDYTDMPAWLAEILPSAYPDRSIEGRRDFVCQQGHKHPFVITGVALLGVETPAIGVLNDIAELYGLAAATEPDGTGEKWSIDMGAKLFAASVTIDDVRKAYMAQAGYSRWICSMQLNPPQLIVCDDMDDQLYRVPIKIGDSGITFGDAVAVGVEYVDTPVAAAALIAKDAAVFYASRAEAEAGLRAAWDAGQEVKNLGDDPTQAQLDAMFALPGDNKSDSKLPHHDVSADGEVGAADLAGCQAALDAINGAQGGLKGVSDADRRKAYDHVAHHLEEGGKTPAPFKASAPEPVKPDPATGPAKVKATTRPKGRTTNPGGHKVFTDEQLAQLRTALGLPEDHELTGDEIMAAFAKLGDQGGKPAGDGDGKPATEPEPEPVKVAASVLKNLPPGAIVVSQDAWDALKLDAAKGATALRRMEVNERDSVITAAIGHGKFGPAQREHWTRLWDSDPDGTRAVIASLQKNAIPVADMGAAGSALEDEEFEQEYAGLFGPKRGR